MASVTTGGVTTTGTILTNTDQPFLQVGTARTITIGGTSVNLALTSTCRFISILAVGGNHCHYQIGVGAQTATSSSHYLKTGERVILAVPADANIAAIQGTGGGTTLYISELVQ
jgi:hypothetical protein